MVQEAGCAASPACFADGRPPLNAEPAPSARWLALDSTLSPHAAHRFCRSCLNLHLDAAMHVRSLPSASTPMPTRSPPRRPAPGLAGADAEGRAAPTRDGAYLLDVRQCYSAAVERTCCIQFELIVRPRLDRASNDASICPCRSPIPTQRGPPTHTVL
ncbi:hypothetical protein C8R44DRAFT_973855 [Mycena epipterygia]|nr:hypothetical protein C8R44DRAFT_973855 [Mycena epipterygia]